MQLLALAFVLCLFFIPKPSYAVTYVAGDIAPYGAPDGVLNAGDLVVLMRFATGDLTPTAQELLVADVAPLGAPDGILNAADVLILQRALIGAIPPLPDIVVGPDAPVLDVVTSPTNFNPQLITGSAAPGDTVTLYVNGTLQNTVTANASDGSFSFSAVLDDGINTLYTTAVQAGEVSVPSNTLSVEYINNIPRNQAGTVIATDTVWTAGNTPTPYTIASHLTIAQGATLTLQPGVEIRFNKNNKLDVNGTLIVNGSSASPVVLTSNAALARGEWVGVVINSTASNVVIDNANITWAQNGIQVNSAQNVTISNSSITEFSSNGIYFSGETSGLVDGNLIDNTNKTGRCINLYNTSANPLVGQVMVTGNTLTKCSNGIEMRKHSPLVQGNIIQGNNTGLWIYGNSNPVVNNGNVISGNSQYGIYVSGYAGNSYPVVNNNSIYSNGTGNRYNYYTTQFNNGANVTLNARNNYWGNINTLNIASWIYDYSDTADLPVVAFGPPTNSIGDPVPGNYIDGGPLGENTTLLADETYHVTGVVTVPVGITLNIEQGALLKFIDNATLSIFGTLQVNGVTSNPVTFTTIRATPTSNLWGGVIVKRGAINTVVNHAVLEWAKTGIKVIEAQVILSSITARENSTGVDITSSAGYLASGALSSSQIQNCSIGVSVSGGTSSLFAIYGNIIENNATGITVSYSSPLVQSNIIQNNTDTGIYLNGNAMPLIGGPSITDGNTITGNSRGLHLNNPGSSSSSHPRPTINNNYIYNNSISNIFNSSSSSSTNNYIIDANNNYWGSTNVLDIASKVYDHTDNSALPYIDYTPFNNSDGTEYFGYYIDSGTLTGVTVLEPGVEYYVLGGITVASDATLTIEQGTTLRFMNNALLQVDGALIVNGTPNNRVTFTSASPTSGYWPGIRFNSGCNNCQINGAFIENATRAIEANGVSNLSITNTIIENYDDVGIYVTNVLAGTIQDNTLDNQRAAGNTRGTGIYLQQSTLTALNNIIQYSVIGIRISQTSSPSIQGNTIQYNTEGIRTELSSSPSIQGNTIQANSYGVVVYSSSQPLINGGNYIVNNTSYGVRVEGTNTAGGNPDPVVNGNFIYGNGYYNYIASSFYNPADSNLDATGNWWGTTNFSEIAQKLYDYTDSATGGYPYINFFPFLDEVGNPIIGNYLNGGTLPGDLTISSGASYDIGGTVIVPPGSTLTVEAGATLRFASNAELYIEGSLVVAGAAGNPVTFTSGNTAANLARGAWKGIYATDSASISIDNAVIQWASTAVEAVNATSAVITNSLVSEFDYGIKLSGTTGAINNNYFTNFDPLYPNAGWQSGTAIYVSGCSPAIFDNVIKYVDKGVETINSSSLIKRNRFYVVDNGVLLSDSSPTINENLFYAGFYGIEIVGNNISSSPLITNNTIANNADGISITGSWIDQTTPQPVINNNDFYGNTYHDLSAWNYESNTAIVLDATENWWGTTNPVYGSTWWNGNDIFSEYTSLINYSPFLLSPAYHLPMLDDLPGNVYQQNIAVTGHAKSNREIRLYVNGAFQASVISGGDGSFSLPALLIEGQNTIYATDYDGVTESLGSPEKQVTRSVLDDSIPPVITVTYPVEGAITNNYVTFSGSINEAATLTIAGQAVTVAADNTFTYGPVVLTEGNNAVLLSATDIAGNVGTLTVNVILDTTPPPGPVESLITFNDSVPGQVSVTGAAGSVEAGANVSVVNARSGEVVTTVAAADGSFTLIMSVQAGDELSVVVTDDIGNQTPWLGYSVNGSPPALAFNITSPTNGQVVSTRTVNVTGTLTGPVNSGVNVNGVTGIVNNGRFFVTDVPVNTSGSTTLLATAADINGNTITQSIDVTTYGFNRVKLTVTPDVGVAPAEVTFRIDRTDSLFDIGDIEVDVDGDGTNDLSIYDFSLVWESSSSGSMIASASATYTYSVPGNYNARVIVRDTSGYGGVYYVLTHPVVVQSAMGASAIFHNSYNQMLGKLKTGDPAGALSLLTGTMQNKFQAFFNDASIDFTALAGQLGEVVGGGVSQDVAQLVIKRNEAGQDHHFTVYFVRGSDGIWRIGEM
ncbi:MAG: right-handed parallel beta-helix repeat-containing protein [Gammaproteobacteria bacterium]|nr:right-handed parallel beta-helix repeat-containing protein [Gammaproteobacteria bacterium]